MYRRVACVDGQFFVTIFGRRIILPNGPQYMSETPAPCDPGQDGTPPGTPPGPGDHPSPDGPGWRLVPQTPDSPDWLTGDDAHAGDDYPGDLEEYEDPDNAPPPGLDDAQLAALLAESLEVSAEQARAAEVRDMVEVRDQSPARRQRRH
jgi:hypothetical protein